jgi:hypothetical protein
LNTNLLPPAIQISAPHDLRCINSPAGDFSFIAGSNPTAFEAVSFERVSPLPFMLRAAAKPQKILCGAKVLWRKHLVPTRDG